MATLPECGINLGDGWRCFLGASASLASSLVTWTRLGVSNREGREERVGTDIDRVQEGEREGQ